jgi:hypothetical protein
MSRMVKVVADTNVLVSAFLFPGGPPEDVFRLTVAGEVQLGTSEPILKELLHVLKRKFKCPASMLEEVETLVRVNCVMVAPTETIRVIADEPDNRVLECAVSFSADYIVSGDRHLLNLKKYKAIQIIKVNEFITRMSGV